MNKNKNCNHNSPSEFNEFFGLINTTAARKMNAKQVKESGYLRSDNGSLKSQPGKYKPKPKSPSKKNAHDKEWDRKIAEHRQRVLERTQQLPPAE